jgi:hypothetical protein
MRESDPGRTGNEWPQKGTSAAVCLIGRLGRDKKSAKKAVSFFALQYPQSAHCCEDFFTTTRNARRKRSQQDFFKTSCSSCVFVVKIGLRLGRAVFYAFFVAMALSRFSSAGVGQRRTRESGRTYASR